MFDWQLIPPQIAALPSYTDTPPEALTFIHPEGADPGNNTAWRDLPGFFAGTDRSLPAAVLPRAFGFVWGANTDHHLLQVGFDLGPCNIGCSHDVVMGAARHGVAPAWGARCCRAPVSLVLLRRFLTC